ncbi:hypothetical protein C810_01420 [Lachnospiraceae bacterium A2]|nr:hypothetical protein C810_01420 [Lachnospiraceae bacterium A2]
MKLRLVKQGDFLGTKCDFYVDEDNNIYMSRTQIGYALEYKDPSNAVKNIHNKYQERFDRFSVEVSGAQFVPPINKNKNSPKIYMYAEKGIYEVCRRSRQTVADKFYDWAYDTISEIKKNGFYIANGKDEKWIGIRRETKQVRKNETDMIQKFVDYAISQGSQNAKRYYTHLTNLANKRCGIKTGERDKADQKTLLRLKSLETLIDMRLETLMNNNIPYKEVFSDVKDMIEGI